jgi:hypothetical protein
MDNPDKLRQELADLRARIKPQAEWTMQDRLEQRAIEQRIRHLQNILATKGTENELRRALRLFSVAL